MKDKIKTVFIRVLYILFALFASIALWLFVEITDNEFITKDITIHEADFIIKNLELLDSRGLLVSRIPTEELTLTFEGPLGEISKLTADTVTVEIDLENVRTAGTFPLIFTEVYSEGVNSNVINVINRSSSQVIVLIDKMNRQDFRVEVNYTGGTASDDYIAEEAIVEPSSISISGPEELISRIAHIYVPIKAENLFNTYTDELGYILVDENGIEIDPALLESRTLTASHDTVLVTIPIMQVKELPLRVELSHGNTTSDENVTWQCDPQTIEISGDPAAIRDFGNSITIGTQDMTSFGLSGTNSFPIVLPDHITNISNISVATVTFQVLNMDTDFRNVTNFSTVNVPAGYTATVRTQVLDVRLRGTEADMAFVTPVDIWVFADLTDMRPGQQWVVAKPQIPGGSNNVDIIGDYRIVVRLEEDTLNGVVP